MKTYSELLIGNKKSPHFPDLEQMHKCVHQVDTAAQLANLLPPLYRHSHKSAAERTVATQVLEPVGVSGWWQWKSRDVTPGSPLPQGSCNIQLPLKLVPSQLQRTLGGWPFWDLCSKDMSKGYDKSKSGLVLH